MTKGILTVPMAFGGRLIDACQPCGPDGDRFDVLAIAEGLGKQARFNGQTAGAPYSVAQHCCRVHDMVEPDVRAHALLHDVAEAWLGELTRPAMRLIEIQAKESGFIDHVKVRHVIEGTHDQIFRQVYAALGLDAPTRTQARMVRHADDIDCAAALRDLCGLSTASSVEALDALPVPPSDHVITPWSWHRAADEWLSRFYALFPAYRTAGRRPALSSTNTKDERTAS